MRHVIGRHRAAHGTPASWLKIAVAIALSFAGLLAAGSARADTQEFTLTLIVTGPGTVSVSTPTEGLTYPTVDLETTGCYSASASSPVPCFAVWTGETPPTVSLTYTMDDTLGHPKPNWTGCDTPPTDLSVCTVTLNANKTVSVVFGGYVTVDTESHVSVQSSPAGIDACDKSDEPTSASCTEFFAFGQVVTLTFDWEGNDLYLNNLPGDLTEEQVGDCPTEDTTPATDATCTFTVRGDGSITPNSYVTVTADPINSGPGRYLDTSLGGIYSCGFGSVLLAGGDCITAALTDSTFTFEALTTPGVSVQWSSNCTSTPIEDHPIRCSATAGTEAMTISATWGYLLTVETVGTGTVSSTDPSGITNCGGTPAPAPDCTEVIIDTSTSGTTGYTGTHETVRLQAAPGTDRSVHWSDTCVPVKGSETQCDVTLDLAKTVTATFGYKLTVDAVDYPYFYVADVLTGGYVIGCGRGAPSDPRSTLCEAFYPEPEESAEPAVVALTTFPFNGFTRWSSDCEVDTEAAPIDWNTCAVTMDQSRSVTATPQRTLTVTVTGPGTVSSVGSSILTDCGPDDPEDPDDQANCQERLDTAPSGTVVTLAATQDDPLADLDVLWSDNCEVDEQDPDICTITVDDFKTVSATFEVPPASLDVIVDGAYIGLTEPTGWVASSNGLIQLCTDLGTSPSGPTCSNTFADGTEVILGAFSSDGVFYSVSNLEVEWSPNCVPLDLEDYAELSEAFQDTLQTACAVTLDGDTEVTATFGFPLDVEISGTGTVSDGEFIACGIEDEEVCRAVIARAATPTPVTVTAYPGDDREVRWEGCDDVDGDNCTVDMDEAKYVTATFGFILEVERLGAAGAVDSELESEISDCGKPDGDCTEFYAEEPTTALVTLTATPEDGTKTFDFQWTDCDPVDGHPDQCDVTMDQARSVTVMIGYLLHIDVTGTGASIDSNELLNPLISNCGDTPNDCEEVYAPNHEVTLTATLDERLSIQWSDECESVGHDPETCVVTMDAAKNVTAFVGYLLDVEVTGTGASIDSNELLNPLISDCGTSGTPDCQEVYDPNQEVTLTATLDDGLSIQWSDICDSGGDLTLSCTLTMDGPKSVSATVGYLLTVTISGTGSGTVAETSPGTRIDCQWGGTGPVTGDCSEVVPDDGTVSLDATTTADTFDLWGDDATSCGTTATACVVTVDADKTASAAFSLGTVGPVMKDLTVTKPGGGSGTVSSSPAGLRCGLTCTASFEVGTDVVLTAKAAKGSAFRGWSFTGAPEGTACVGGTSLSSQCTVNLSDDREVVALFEPLRTLTVTKTGLGTVTSVSVPTQTNQIACGTKCSTQFAEGDLVTLTATGPGASTWVWTAGCDDAPAEGQIGGTCQVTVDGIEAVRITFTIGGGETYSTITLSVGRGGYVDSSPAGINCPSLLCTATFRTDSGAASNVVLTAHPATGYTGATWTGCPSGTTGLTCTISKGSALPSYTIKVRFTR